MSVDPSPEALKVAHEAVSKARYDVCRDGDQASHSAVCVAVAAAIDAADQAAREDERRIMLKHTDERINALHKKNPWLLAEMERTGSGTSNPMRLNAKRALVFGAMMELGLMDVMLDPDEDDADAQWTCPCNYRNAGPICTHCGARKPADG